MKKHPLVIKITEEKLFELLLSNGVVTYGAFVEGSKIDSMSWWKKDPYNDIFENELVFPLIAPGQKRFSCIYTVKEDDFLSWVSSNYTESNGYRIDCFTLEKNCLELFFNKDENAKIALTDSTVSNEVQELKDRIKYLEKQVDKMKCCGNCRWHNKDKCKATDCQKNNLKHWGLLK